MDKVMMRAVQTWLADAVRAKAQGRTLDALVCLRQVQHAIEREADALLLGARSEPPTGS